MRKILITSLILLSLLMTACAAASIGTKSGSVSQALSMQTELILGTLKLEGTEQAITKDQAATLLPLWTLMQKLQDSDSAAQEEKDAVLNQIRSTMTTEQNQAIEKMKLTMQDAMTVIQNQSASVSDPQASGNIQSQNFAGGPPAGDDPMAGMGGGPMMESVSTSSTQTASGQNVTSQNANQIPTEFIEALINLLEKKVAS